MAIDKQYLLERITLTELATGLGLVVQSVGLNWQINPCPSCGHKDCFRWKKEGEQLFKCFSGSCNAGGDIFSLYNLIHPESSYTESVQGIAELFNLQDDKAGAVDPQALPQQEDKTILQNALDFYLSGTSRPTFSAWKRSRNYQDNILQAFGIGFADGKRQLHTHLTGLGCTKEQMLESGLIRWDKKNSKLYDLFYKPSIIFPYKNKQGAVCHLKAKPVNRQGQHTGNPYQLKSTDTTPYFFGMQYRKSETNQLYIVEGETDVLGMAHMKCVAWGLGKNMSRDQGAYIGSIIEEGKVDVVLSFDNDPAGQEYHERLSKYAQMPKLILDRSDCGHGRMFRVNAPSGYKDPDEAFRAGDLEWPFLYLPVFATLKTCLYEYRSTVTDENKWSADHVARILFDWFSANGTFYVKDDEVFLTFEGKAYTIDSRLPFKSLIYRMAGINYATKSSKAIWEALAAIGYSEARHIDGAGWLHNSQAPPVISWHIGNNTIATMQEGRVSTAPAGTGEVMLIESPKLKPITIQQDVDINTGLTTFFRLANTALACSQPWQLYLTGLFINSLFLGWSRAHGVHNFTGNMGCGKSDAANFLTALIYGQTFVTAGSTASNYTDATQNPLTVLDNLESRNMGNDVRDFLLHVGTGIVRQKRKAGTDSENVYERAQTQIVTTSIEQTETPELIERTIIIPFARRWFTDDHPGSSILEAETIRNRNGIITAIMRLAAQMLPTFEADRAAMLELIRQKHPNHAKQRLNEHLATVATITNAMLSACPDHPYRIGNATAALEYWIGEQNVFAAELAADSNPIIRYLDLLETEWRAGHTEIQFQDDGSQIWAEITLDKLLAEFDLIARRFQLKDRYNSVRHLSVRVVNERDILQRSGWTIDKKCKRQGRQVYTICRNFKD